MYSTVNREIFPSIYFHANALNRENKTYAHDAYSMLGLSTPKTQKIK
jgi:hypothetical protein